MFLDLTRSVFACVCVCVCVICVSPHSQPIYSKLGMCSIFSGQYIGAIINYQLDVHVHACVHVHGHGYWRFCPTIEHNNNN